MHQCPRANVSASIILEMMNSGKGKPEKLSLSLGQEVINEEEKEILLDVVQTCLSDVNDPIHDIIKNFMNREGMNTAQVVRLIWSFGLKYTVVKERGKEGKSKIRKQLLITLKELREKEPIFEPDFLSDRWQWYIYKFLQKRNLDLYSKDGRSKKRQKRGKECFGTFIWARESDFQLITDHSSTIPQSKNPKVVLLIYRKFPEELIPLFPPNNPLYPEFLHEIVRNGPGDNTVEGAELFQLIDVDCDGINQTKGNSCVQCTPRNPQMLKRMNTSHNILNDREKSFKILVYGGRGSSDFRSCELQKRVKEKYDFYKSTLHQASFRNILCLTERENDFGGGSYGFKWRFVSKTASGAKTKKLTSLNSITESERVKKETKKLIKICDTLLNFFLAGREFTNEAVDGVRKRLNHEISVSKIGDLSDIGNFLCFSRSLMFSTAQFRLSSRFFNTPTYEETNQKLNVLYQKLASDGTIKIFNGTGIVSSIPNIMKMTTPKIKVIEILVVSIGKFLNQSVFIETQVNPERLCILKDILERYSIRNIQYDPTTKTIKSNTPQKVSMDATPSEHETVKKLDIGVTNNADVNGVLQFSNSQVWYVNCGEADYSDWEDSGCLKDDFDGILSLVSCVDLNPEEEEVVGSLLESFPKSMKLLMEANGIKRCEVTYEPYGVFDMVGGNNLQVNHESASPSEQFKDFRVKYKSFDRELIIMGDLDEDTKTSFLRLPLASQTFKVITGWSKDDDLYENGTVTVRGFEIQEPSAILNLNILRNTGWCYLHFQGSDMNWLGEFLREDSMYKGKLFYPNAPEKVEMLSNKICSFWVRFGLLAPDGSGIKYKDYENLTRNVVDEFHSQLEYFVLEVGHPGGLTFEEYEDTHLPIFHKQLIHVSNACSSLRYRGKPQNGEERWDMLCDVDFFTVTMDRNVEQVKSIRDYGAIGPSVLGVETAIKPSLLDIRGDLQEHICQKSRSSDSCTSGVIDDFGINNTKFYLSGSDDGQVFGLSTESNYALQQTRNFWCSMNPKYNPLNRISPSESVTWEEREAEIKNPDGIVFVWSEFRDDESINCQQYQDHLVELFNYFHELTEYNLKKRRILLGYHTVRLNTQEPGWSIPLSMMNWFNNHQKRIIGPLNKSYWDEEDYTLQMYMGTGKTPTIAMDVNLTLHSHEKGNAMILTTETVKDQTKVMLKGFENIHKLQQSQIEVTNSAPGKMLAKRLFRARWNVLIASHSNLNGILNTIEKSSQATSYHWECFLSLLLRIYIDEYDEAVAKESNRKYQSIVRLQQKVQMARDNFMRKRLMELQTKKVSRIFVPSKRCTKVLLSGTGYNCVNDALFNAFKLTNPNVEQSTIRKLKEKMNRVENIFSQETEKIMGDEKLLDELSSLADDINGIILRNWKRLYVVGPDSIEGSSGVNICRKYVIVKQSTEQTQLWWYLLRSCGIEVKKKNNKNVDEENVMKDDEEEGTGNQSSSTGCRFNEMKDEEDLLPLGELLSLSVKKRMTLNQRSPKICDDPNVMIKEIYGEDSAEHEIPVERIPKLLIIKHYVRITLYAKLKFLVIGRSVEGVEFLEQHIKSFLGVFFSKKTEVFLMTGKTPTKKREPMIKKFREAKSPSIFISTADVIAKGANLQFVQLFYIMSTDFNPAKEDQIVCRADRFGRVDDLSVTKCVSDDCIQVDTLFREWLKTWLSRVIIYQSNIKVPRLWRGRLGSGGFATGLDLSNFPLAERVEKEMKDFADKWVVEVYDHDLLFGLNEKMDKEEEQ